MFANFVCFCTTRGKKTPLTGRLLKLLRVIRIYTKFANFAGLDFRILQQFATTLSNFTNQNLVHSWNNLLISRYTVII